MKFRKLLAVILGLSISIGCVVPSFATSSRKYIKILKPNKTYYYDIDGDKDKDKIKIKVSKKSSTNPFNYPIFSDAYTYG